MDTDILMLSAICAAYVGVAKKMGLNTKYSPLLALAAAAAITLIPPTYQDALIKISIIGLTASGFYSYTKQGVK
jgi:hypothetical protein